MRVAGTRQQIPPRAHGPHRTGRPRLPLLYLQAFPGPLAAYSRNHVARPLEECAVLRSYSSPRRPGADQCRTLTDKIRPPPFRRDRGLLEIRPGSPNRLTREFNKEVKTIRRGQAEAAEAAERLTPESEEEFEEITFMDEEASPRNQGYLIERIKQEEKIPPERMEDWPLPSCS